MNEKKIKFLQEINNGTIRGAQKLIAKKLGIAGSSVSVWFTGDKKPSLDSILKMAKIFKKSEKEISEVFAVENKNISGDNSNFADIKDMRLLEERMKRFETEIAYLKERMDRYENKK